jgi:hypothetical protein
VGCEVGDDLYRDEKRDSVVAKNDFAEFIISKRLLAISDGNDGRLDLISMTEVMLSANCTSRWLFTFAKRQLRNIKCT